MQRVPSSVLRAASCCAGLPAITVPAGFEGSPEGKRLPVGLQIIGKAFGEANIIKIAHIFEQTADFAPGTPPGF